MSLVNWHKVQSDTIEVTLDGTQGADSARLQVLAKRPDKLQLILNACLQKESFHFVSDGSWSMHDFIIGIIDHYPNAQVYLTTYAITETSARILCDLLLGKKISELHILGDYRIRDRYPAVQQLLEMNASIKGTQIHGKVLVIQSGNKCLTLLGSANWTTNPRIELGVIDRSESVASFHKQWIIKKMNDSDVFE